MTSLRLLSKDECRLMSREVIDLYNALASVLEDARKQIPVLWSDADITDDYLPWFDEVKRLVQRTHYRVGFIGGSQTGKSSTFNSILGFRDGEPDRPAKGGSGKATTATTTRLVSIPKESDKPACISRFMSRSQLDRRIRALLREYDHPMIPEAAWTGDIEALLKLTQQAATDLRQRNASTARVQLDDASLLAQQASLDDLQYLEKYLQSLLLREAGESVYEKYIQVEAVERSFEYSQREAFLNHSAEDRPDTKLLQRDVVIKFPTDAISERLEMIDLPGLGAKLLVDTVLTTEFITQELDASIVCLRADEVAPGEFFRVMDLFKKHFRGDMAGRVWVVITKLDQWTTSHLPSDPKQDNVIDGIRSSLDATSVPHQNTYFSSNRFFWSHLAKQGQANSDQAAVDWGEELGVKFVDGQPQLPECWTKGKVDLGKALGRVFKAGGIPAIRELLQTTIAEIVETRIRHQATQDLKTLAKKFAAKVEATKALVSLDDSALVHAAQWEAKIRDAKHKLMFEYRVFEEPARQLQTLLHTTFATICSGSTNISPSRLPEKHIDFGNSLVSTALGHLRNKTVHQLNAIVMQFLADGPSDVEIWGYQNPLVAWRERFPATDEQWRLLAAKAYEPLVATLKSFDLFPKTNVHAFLNIDEYKILINEKIKVLVHQLIHQINLYLRDQLTEIEEQLMLLQRGGKLARRGQSSISPAVFDAIAARLRALADGNVEESKPVRTTVKSDKPAANSTVSAAPTISEAPVVTKQPPKPPEPVVEPSSAPVPAPHKTDSDRLAEASSSADSLSSASQVLTDPDEDLY